MARSGKSSHVSTGKPASKGLRRAGTVALSLITAIVFVVGAVVDLSGVSDIVRKIWPRPIQPMSGDINVLYVPFTSDPAVAEELVTVLGESYRDELLRRLPPALAGSTGHDISYNLQIRVPDEVDLDAHAGSAERVDLYQRIMRDHHSDMVVSGHLTDTGTSVILQSEVFLGEGSLEGAAELGGIHYLDFDITPVGVERNPEARRRARAQFIGQIEAYAQFIAAVSLSVYGDNGAALAGLERVRDDWSSPRQRKIIDVFLGNVWGRLNDRVQAESYYADALAVDPSYDRARLGLAEIDYQRG
ncbi:MAG: hypothetical protein LC799_27275, partial [Actinobacteria bacterium]|nr:hypothetical protein [Actinomycetota bacterium]